TDAPDCQQPKGRAEIAKAVHPLTHEPCSKTPVKYVADSNLALKQILGRWHSYRIELALFLALIGLGFTVQSNVTAHIKKLEEELDAKLLDRHGSVRLTS